MHRVRHIKKGTLLINSNIFISLLLGSTIGLIAIAPLANLDLFAASEIFSDIVVILAFIAVIVATIVISRVGMGNKILLTSKQMEITVSTGRYSSRTFEFEYQNIVGVKIQKRSISVVMHDKTEEVKTGLKLGQKQIQALSQKVKIIEQFDLSTQQVSQFIIIPSLAGRFAMQGIFASISALIFGIAGRASGFGIWPTLIAFGVTFLLSGFMGREKNYFSETEVHYESYRVNTTRPKSDVTQATIKKALTGYSINVTFQDGDVQFMGTVNEENLQNFLSWNKRLKNPYNVVNQN
ncbi:MAG: hypothetical protein FWG64_06170 [Firmicutes bacterium]|nr:hypothetical protein [Bacillota bacterium]